MKQYKAFCREYINTKATIYAFAVQKTLIKEHQTLHIAYINYKKSVVADFRTKKIFSALTQFLFDIFITVNVSKTLSI